MVLKRTQANLLNTRRFKTNDWRKGVRLQTECILLFGPSKFPEAFRASVRNPMEKEKKREKERLGFSEENALIVLHLLALFCVLFLIETEGDRQRQIETNKYEERQ